MSQNESASDEGIFLDVQRKLNFLGYTRAFARRTFLKNVGLAGASVAAGMFGPKLQFGKLGGTFHTRIRDR